MPAESQRAARPQSSAAQYVALLLIRVYQVALSPMFPGSCRFTPSCSHYAAESISRFGVVRGNWLAARRLMRCHPFGGHGFDPVPDFAPREVRRGRLDTVPLETRRDTRVQGSL